MEFTPAIEEFKHFVYKRPYDGVELFKTPIEKWTGRRFGSKTTYAVDAMLTAYFEYGMPSRIYRRKRQEKSGVNEGLITEWLANKWQIEQTTLSHGKITVKIDGVDCPFLTVHSLDEAGSARNVPPPTAIIYLDEDTAKAGEDYFDRELTPPTAWQDIRYSVAKSNRWVRCVSAGNESLRFNPYTAEIEEIGDESLARIVDFPKTFEPKSGEGERTIFDALGKTVYGAYSSSNLAKNSPLIKQPSLPIEECAVQARLDGVKLISDNINYFIVADPDAPAVSIREKDGMRIVVRDLYESGFLYFPTKEDMLEATRVFKRMLLF
jgi:hypothetical protein